MEYLDDFELPALVYMGATAVCFVIDLISFFICIGVAGSFKKKGLVIFNLATSIGDQIP